MDSSTASYDYPKKSLMWIYAMFYSRIVMIGMTILVLSDLMFKTNIICCVIGKRVLLNVVVIILVLAAVLLNLFNRNYYLPFLGYSAYPCGSLTEKVPANADTEVKVLVPPNVNVIYWASEPSKPGMEPISNPWDAYANYENAGVVKADASGVAVLKFRTPSSYYAGMMQKKLDRHVHYRVCKHPGMLSSIKTVFVQ